MKLAWHRMGFTANLRADATSVSTLEHVIFFPKKYVFLFSSIVSKIWPMLHMLKMHWLFVLKAASSEGHSFSKGVGGIVFRGLSIIPAQKRVVLLLFAEFYRLFCSM